MRERMDTLFDDLLGGGPLEAGGRWSPPVEESDDAWVVEADLPGVKEGDVTVEVRAQELAITGELKERERKGILRRRTRRTGQFDYRVTLPGELDAENVEAPAGRRRPHRSHPQACARSAAAYRGQRRLTYHHAAGALPALREGQRRPSQREGHAAVWVVSRAASLARRRAAAPPTGLAHSTAS